MTTNSIPLDKLVLSPLNVRQTDDDHDTSDLEASIEAHGLLARLIAHKVTKPRGHYGVLAGGRRLRALQRLRDRDAIAVDFMVDVEIRDLDDATATEISVIENTARVALPPVEEFTAFAKLAADGADVAAIAKRFGTTELHVKQRMRLGQLHPDILAALSAGRMTLDTAKAYASTSDLALQKRVFEQRPAHDFEVRAAIKRDLVNAGVERMLRLVGLDAYAAAGGRAEEDLFNPGEAHIQDVGVLQRLYDVKLQAERERLGLPDHVTLSFAGGGLGMPVHLDDEPTEEQRRELLCLELKAERLAAQLDSMAEYDQDGVTPRWVADPGADQDEVNRIATELVRCNSDIDGMASGGYPDGPLIQVAHIGSGELKLGGIFRPLGWVDTAPTVSRDRAPIAAPAATEEKPVISAFRQDRAAYSGVYRQPEDIAKQEHGLTKDAVEAMRSHHRRILGAAIMRDAFAHRYGSKFLTFVMARGLLRQGDAKHWERETAADLGVHGLPGLSIDPAQVAPDLADQPASHILQDEVMWLRDRAWMTEADPAAALRLTLKASHTEMERANALVAMMMMARSLDAPGFVLPVHQALAAMVDVSMRVREFFTPDAVYFARLSKNEKLKAIRAVDESLVKRVSNLGADDLSTAAALIMTGSPAAAEQFGMTREACQRAKGWVPPYLSFEGQDDDVDDDGADEEAA